MIPIRPWFKWLARENRILSNPASELELPRPEKWPPALVLTAEETNAVMAVPDTGEPLGLRDRAMLELLYAIAIRHGNWSRTHCSARTMRGVPMVRQARATRTGCCRLASRRKRGYAPIATARALA